MTTDLTMEQLDELERRARWPRALDRDDVLALIAMAKRTEAAERFLSMSIDESLWGTCDNHAPGIQPGDCETRDCHIDPLVYEIVMGLWEAGVRTHSSCQGGGPPHALMTRTVRIGPDCVEGDGERAFQVARKLGMPVFAMARVTADDKFWYELWFGQEPWDRSMAGSSMAEREPHKLGDDGSSPSRPTKSAHPDAGGSEERMKELNEAIAAVRS